MSDDSGANRPGGSVSTSSKGGDNLPPAYFRPSPSPVAKVPSPDGPTTPLPTGGKPTETGATVLRPAAATSASRAPGAPRAAAPANATRNPSEVLSSSSKRTRKARLRLARLDPWSVMKTVFLFSVAGAIMAMVAVGVVWMVIENSGMLDDLNTFIGTLVSTPSDPTPFDITSYVNGPRVLGATAVISAINIVLFTALGTLGSFLYNLSATMLGGLEVTLAED